MNQRVEAPPTPDFQALLESAPDAMVIADERGRIVLVNAQAERLFGYRREQLIGQPVEMLIPERFHAGHAGHRQTYFKNPSVRPMGAGLELYARRCGGGEIPVEISLSPLETDQGRLISTAIRDVSERRKVQAQLEGLLETAPDAMVVANGEGRIVLVNAQTERLFRYARAELIDQPIEKLLPERFRGAHSGHFKRFFDNPAPRSMGAGVELYGLRSDGAEIPMEISLNAWESADGMLVSSAIRDVTERRRQQLELEWIADHDLLSGLLNRRGMLAHLKQAVARARRDSSSVVVLLFDLDRFKLINDSHGHEVGDALLQQVASRLQQAMRSGDTVTRVGGDEFAVIAEGVAPGSSDGAWVAERIINALREPFSCANQPHVVQASIGISVFPGDGSDPTELLRYADMAMYEAKERGGDSYAWANEDTAQRVSHRLATERALRQAIDNDELELHYQPQYRLADGQLRGVEALLRWPAAIAETFDPAEVVLLAESSGLILSLGEWILERALADFARLMEAYREPLRLAVNLSVKQFYSASLAEEVIAALARHGLSPSQLELEITEQALLQDVEQTQRILTSLRDIGVNIALDDFGTGYSSLSYLKRFDIDTLKIDSEFINDLEQDENDQAIVRAILAMAAQLQMTVIAEGVETTGQAARLVSEGCDFGQGFYWSKARPANELRELLATELLRDTRAR